MKMIGIIGTAALLLGIAAPGYAQQEQHEQQQDQHDQQQEQKDKPAQQQEKQGQQQEKKAQQQENQAKQENQHGQQEKTQQDKSQQQEQHAKEAKPAQNDHQAQQENQHAQQGHNEQSQRSPEQQRVEQGAWQEHRARSWQSDHRTWQQRGGYAGYRIPDDRFRGHFGPDHDFRIYGLPFLVVGGYPRFQYSGYWFSMVDPWPEYWASNWYDTDDVFVLYSNNGYYLYNRRYPTVGLAISISL